MSSDQSLLAILNLVKNIENGKDGKFFCDADRGSKSLSQLQTLSSAIQTNNTNNSSNHNHRKRQRRTTGKKRPIQQPFSLAWGSLPSANQKEHEHLYQQTKTHDTSALSLMLESSPQQSRNSSRQSRRSSNKSRQSRQSRRSSISTKLEVLLPGAHQVISNAAESGRSGLYDRLHQHGLGSPSLPSPELLSKRQRSKTSDRMQPMQPIPSKQTASTTPTIHHTPSTPTPTPPTSQPMSPISPSTNSAVPSEASPSPTTIPSISSLTPTPTSPTFLPISTASEILHMPPIHFHSHRSPPQRFSPHRRIQLDQQQEKITHVLETAVEHARSDARKSSAHQSVTIEKYTKLLPESFVMHCPSLRSEIHVRAMQKIVDCVWAFYLKAYMRPTWEKWTDMCASYLAELQWNKSIVLQKILARGIQGRERVLRLKRIKYEKIEKNQIELQNRIKQRIQAMIRIQTTVRRFVVQQRVEREILLPKRAVHCISRFWRALAASRMVKDMKEKREKREYATSMIQRCWTGYRGRCQFWEELRQHRVAEREKHLLDPIWVIRHEFEKKGALLRIQRWWRNYLGRKYFAKRLMVSMKRIMATKIQAMYRSIMYGRYRSKRKLKYMLSKKEYQGNWVTCGKNKKVVQWTSEILMEKMIKKGILRYMKNKSKRDNPDGTAPVTELSSGSLMAKLGLGGSISAKLKLKKWRRRADLTIVAKHERLNELRHPLERRAIVYPFDISNLRACGKRDLYDLSPPREKQGLRRLIRAMWAGQHSKMSKFAQRTCQSYFHTKRNGNTEMKKLMQRKDVNSIQNKFDVTGGVSDIQFWQMLGTTSYSVWLNTRRPITLSTASEAFANLLTFREGQNGLNLLQAARVSVSSGDMNRALQLSATCILEFPDAPREVLSQVVMLSALVQRRLNMDLSTVLEYMISLIPTPPKGLDDDHILLQVARIHQKLGNRMDSKAAALEIFSTAKRRRKLPKGVGTFQQWFSTPTTWLNFADDYTKAGYDLASLDCANEALRLSTAKRSGIDLNMMGVDDEEHHHHNNEANTKEDDGETPKDTLNETDVAVLYTPKDGVTIKEAVDAAIRIQCRFRVRRGQLSFHLKRQAILHLTNSLVDEVPYISSLLRVGLGLWRTGEIENGRKHLHKSYLLCYELCQRLSSLNLLNKYSTPVTDRMERKNMEIKELNLHDSISEIVICLNSLIIHLSRMRNVPLQWTWVSDLKMSHSTFYAALAIQNGLRSLLARRKAYTYRLDHAARTVQHLWLNRAEIQAFAYFRKKMWAVKIVQRAWKNRMARFILTMVNRRRESRQRILRSMGMRGIRVKMAVKKVGKLRDQSRRIAEDIRVGKMEFRRTVLYVSDDLLMNGKDPLCELKKMFMEFTTDKERPSSRQQNSRPNSREQEKSAEKSAEKSGRGRSPSRERSQSPSRERSPSPSSGKRMHQQESTIKSMGFKNFLTTTTVCDDNLNMVACDIAFAKAAASHKSSTVLPFYGFVQCLRLLAKEKWVELFADEAKKKKKVRTSLTSTNKDKKKKKDVDQTNKEETTSIASRQIWRKYKGLDAILLKLIHNHCLRHLPSDEIVPETGKMVVQPILPIKEEKEPDKESESSVATTATALSPSGSSGSPGKKLKRKKSNASNKKKKSIKPPPEWSLRVSTLLFSRAEEVVTQSIIRIQNFIRIEKAKSMSIHRRMARANREATTIKSNAATIIQAKFMRYCLSRRRIQSMARSTLTKWIDFDTGYPYWIGPSTKHQFWTKPMLLGHDDVRHIVEAPHPNAEYSLSCNYCSGTASRYCNECDEWFCKEDFTNNHRSGKSTTHTWIDMEICIECSYQIASRNCDRCGDNFCDSCYYARHRLGRMKLHTWKELIPMCQMCDNRTGTRIMGEDNNGAASTTGEPGWYMLDDVGDTLGPFSVEIMAGLFRANRIKADDMICPPPSTEGGASEWKKASETNLSRYGMTPSNAADGALEKYSAMREVFAARVSCTSHEWKEICNVCRHHESHQLCEIDSNLPIGTTAILKARQEEERQRQLALKEQMKEHERNVAKERRKVGAAGRIQGWFRGYLGRQWGKRYMSRVRHQREKTFQLALSERNKRRRITYKLWLLGKCVARTPITMVRLIKGPGLTAEQQIEKDQDMATIKIMKMLNNTFSKRIPGECTIKVDSNEVVLLEQEWNSFSVIDTGGERKPRKRDRIRFQVGLELLGDDDYDNFEFSLEEVSVQNGYLATLTTKIEGEWDNTKPIKVWWSPPITDEEIKERFSQKKAKDALLKKKAEQLRKKQLRVAKMAERLGEDSAMAKRMKRAAGIVVEEDEEEDEIDEVEENKKEAESSDDESGDDSD